MSVVFDTEPLLAFAFGESGADSVERWLDRVYDAEIDGYATTVNLAEFRYVATRITSRSKSDAHIRDLQEMGLIQYDVDDLWRRASDIKADYNPALGDSYAIAAAKALSEQDGQSVTLLVGGHGDFDALEETEEYAHLIERFRSGSD